MYRSASTSRVSDEYLKYSSAPAPSPSKVPATLRNLSLDGSELPLFEVLSEGSKKDKYRAKIAENAVHLIPVVLLLCAFTLWFFSNPEVDMSVKAESIAARVEGLTLKGELEGNTNGGGFMAGVDLGDLDSKQVTLSPTSKFPTPIFNSIRNHNYILVFFF
ncbi:hypothetical protein NMG60_11012149 [Bertholletia excelsa]